MLNILFTGASGFLGRHNLSLIQEKYNVSTIGLDIEDHIQVNLAREIPALPDANYDVVLHAAGKAHVIPKNKDDEKSFYDVNLEGTKNLCLALEKDTIPKSFIFISTVAVYGCDYGENITEEHPLKGSTPYALSKIQAEYFLQEWCYKHNVKLSIIRPSLIAGPNPPGNLGAMIKGIKTGRYLSIGGGQTRKSVLMVEDLANLISLVIDKGGIYNVCDSYHPTFRELETLICSQLGKSLPLSIPSWIAKSMALCGDYIGNRAPINSLKLNKIIKSLTFSNEKAIKELGWKPLNVLENFRIY